MRVIQVERYGGPEVQSVQNVDKPRPGTRRIALPTVRLDTALTRPEPKEPTMTAYVLFDNVEVTDPEGLARYAGDAARTVADHGGRYLSVAATPEPLEGTPVLTSAVLIEFPSREDALAWYGSEAYQPLKALRQRSARNSAALFVGE